ncbi:ABC transporter substrate-binding protein [Herbiconiux sp. CPCC 205716]|uniref:ABC transporter substrate-binding protein n=2 Tax=Herbiconiux gentiana TaxID=2970912 RepID=A0ABT2GAF7_9MICO|nr:ABC transporter substrate-binding protein [Herbiconiux gentiana]
MRQRANRLSSSKKLLTTTAVGVAVVLGLSACAPGSAASTSGGQTLVIGMESEAGALDPQSPAGWVTWRVDYQIYDTLVTEDLSKSSEEAPVTELKPGLASSWTVSPDGLVYTFTIRDANFTDGTPVDAAAVEYNVRRMWDPASPQYSPQAAGSSVYLWQNLADVSSDGQTLTLTMAQPFSPFLRLLAGIGGGGIISPAALEKYGDEGIGDNPVGSGPFKFVDRVRGERITLERNDDYWGDVPELDRVVFRPLPDASARVAALRSGDVDIIAVPSPDSVAGLVDEGYQLSEGTPPHVWFLRFNFDNEYTKNKLVRQAINLAIDREGMAEDLLQGTANPAYDIQAPANDAYVERTDAYTRNLEEAKALLAEAGYPDGFTTTLTTSTDGSGQIVPVPMAEYIQQNLAEVGIDVKIDATEWTSYLGTYFQGTPDDVGLAQLSWGMTSPYWLYTQTSSSLIAPNGPNVGYYSNPELDAVMGQAISATDDAAATELWKQANEIATEDAVFAPIVNDKAPYILAPNVRGFVSASEEWYDLTNVSLD